MGVRNSRMRAGQSFVTFIDDKRRLTSEDIQEMKSATNWSPQHLRRRHVFIRRGFYKWGKDAVFAMSWVESGARLTPALAVVAHVIAPYCCQITKPDSRIWLRTARTLREGGQDEEATYYISGSSS
jgi:hypothetical protein